MRHLGLMLSAGFTLLAPSASWAWGPEGHTIIARVAYSRLSGQAKTDFDWIVQNGIPALNAVTTGCQIDPADPFGPVAPFNDAKTNLANWPDCFRVLHPETAPWHFDDIPRATKLNARSNHLGLLAANPSWCAAGCVSQAMADNLKALAQPSQAPADAARALAYVVHFIGDMHQPLHVEDNGDKGGNDVTVTLPTALSPPGPASKALHSTWDGNLVASAMGIDLDQATSKLALDASAASASLVLGTSTVEATIATSDKWVAVGHNDARTAYSRLTPPPPTEAPPFAPNVGRFSSAMTNHYVTLEDRVVEIQLTAGTVRLGAALTAALTWTPPP